VFLNALEYGVPEGIVFTVYGLLIAVGIFIIPYLMKGHGVIMTDGLKKKDSLNVQRGKGLPSITSITI